MTEQFWEQRHYLRHIRDFARGRRVCPWSTLGVVLVRAVCHLPPHVYLPPLVGGRVAPNLFCALVGPSGVGKGGSESAGREAITYTGKALTDLPELPIGSGEGIARTFHADSDTHSALFSAPEVDSLAALFARQGSTLEGELRKLWMGETLGFTNSQKSTRTYVERLSYRAGVIVGVQPLRADALMAGADGGTPQRFLWMPVLDPDRPEQRPPTPDPFAVEIPDFPIGELDVPDVAVAAIDAHQSAIHAQDPDVDPLAGHALLCRLKVAVALMVLDQRKELNDDDWRLAGHVMAVSDDTRQVIAHAATQKARSVNRARALASADRDEVISERKHQRCRDAILRRLTRHQQQTLNEIRMGLKADVRDYLGSALAELSEQGQIHKTAGQYSLPEGHMSLGHVPQKQPPTSDDGLCPKGTYVPSPNDLAAQRKLRQRRRTRGKHRTAQQTPEGTKP